MMSPSPPYSRCSLALITKKKSFCNSSSESLQVDPERRLREASLRVARSTFVRRQPRLPRESEGTNVCAFPHKCTKWREKLRKKKGFFGISGARNILPPANKAGGRGYEVRRPQKRQKCRFGRVQSRPGEHRSFFCLLTSSVFTFSRSSLPQPFLKSNRKNIGAPQGCHLLRVGCRSS